MSGRYMVDYETTNFVTSIFWVNLKDCIHKLKIRNANHRSSLQIAIAQLSGAQFAWNLIETTVADLKVQK